MLCCVRHRAGRVFVRGFVWGARGRVCARINSGGGVPGVLFAGAAAVPRWAIVRWYCAMILCAARCALCTAGLQRARCPPVLLPHSSRTVRPLRDTHGAGSGSGRHRGDTGGTGRHAQERLHRGDRSPRRFAPRAPPSRAFPCPRGVAISILVSLCKATRANCIPRCVRVRDALACGGSFCVVWGWLQCRGVRERIYSDYCGVMLRRALHSLLRRCADTLHCRCTATVTATVAAACTAPLHCISLCWPGTLRCPGTGGVFVAVHRV